MVQSFHAVTGQRIWISKTTWMKVAGPDENRTIELRSAGAGWPWVDFLGRVWGTGSGTHGPVWRVEGPRPASVLDEF